MGMTGRGVGGRGIAAPLEVGEGTVLSPTSLGICAAPEPWLGVSGCPGCCPEPGHVQGNGICGCNPVKHLEIKNALETGYSFLREMRKSLRARNLGSKGRKCRIKRLAQAFPNPLETLSTLADKFCAVQALVVARLSSLIYFPGRSGSLQSWFASGSSRVVGH